MISMIKSNTKFLIFGQGASGVCAVFGALFTARNCSPEFYGFAAVVIVVSCFFGDAIDFGSCSWATKELAAKRISLEKVLSKLNSRSKKSLSYLLAVPIIYSLSPSSNLALVGFGFLPLLWIRVSYIQQCLITLTRIRIAVALQLLEKISWIIFIFVFIQFDNDIFLIVTPLIISQSIHAILGSIILRRITKIFDPLLVESPWNKASVREFGRQSLISDLASLDNFLVAAFSTLSNSATYSLSIRARGPLLIGAQSLNSVLRPYFARRELREARNVIKSEKNVILLTVAGISILAVMAFFFSGAIVGNGYPQIGLSLTLGILSTLPHLPLMLMANFMQTTGMEVFVRRFTTLTTLAILTSLFVLGLLGSLTAITAILVLILVNTVAMLFMLKIFLNRWRQLSD